MRNITILCSGILALSLLAEPAKADSTTENTLFVVVDLSSYSGEFEFDGTGLLFINIASVGGTFPNITLDIAGLEGEFDLSDFEYFVLGEKTDSEHLIVSTADGSLGNPITQEFEDMVNDGLMDMAGFGDLENPGGMEELTPTEFANHFGTPVGTFTGGGLGFNPVANVGVGVDLLGYSQAQIVFTGFQFNPDGSVTIVPEPTLALLALVGIAGTAIARRRRRRNAA